MVLVPVIIGLLFAAVASPIADRLQRWGVPRGLATRDRGPDRHRADRRARDAGRPAVQLRASTTCATSSTRAFGELERYLADLGLKRNQLQDFFDRVRDGVGSGQSNLGGTVVKTATTAGHLLAGLFIVLFSTIFFIYDGRSIWRWLVRLFPAPARVGSRAAASAPGPSSRRTSARPP